MLSNKKSPIVENPRSKTYDASRSTPVASVQKFAEENKHVAEHLVNRFLTKAEAYSFQDVQPEKVRLPIWVKTKLAVHKDADGAVHVVSAVCTHMGCVVRWNNEETSWDCPCHSSRFSIDGEVLEGPAYEGLKKYGVRH